MATGSLSVTITIPSLNGAGGAGVLGTNNASNSIAEALLLQVAQAIGASGASSGTLVYPSGSTSVVGNWTYNAAS